MKELISCIKNLPKHFKESLVNLEFNVIDNQATTLKLSGKTDQQYFIETTFPLTKEEIIIDKIDDYSEIISECTPSPDMFEFFLLKCEFL